MIKHTLKETSVKNLSQMKKDFIIVKDQGSFMGEVALKSQGVDIKKAGYEVPSHVK